MKPSPLSLVLCLALAAVWPAQAAPQASPAEPVAIVNGKPIFERDLAASIASQMLQLRQQEFQVKDRALQDLIRKKLVELEAKKRSVSPEELLYDEADSKVAEPSDAELEGYYLAVKSQLNQPFDQVKEQLRATVKQLKIQQARQEYEDSLRAAANVVVLLRPPRVEVGYDPARVRGDPNAPITIVEFGDFQCPYCHRAEATLNDLLSKYKGRVKLAFRDYPLRPLHPQAQIAAEAARCAEAQGKFWEYHDMLYASQSELKEPRLIEDARQLGLDQKSFRSCLDSGKFVDQIEQDVQAGSKAGVGGTPAFFINGVFLEGAQPEAEFEKIIDSELAALGSPHSPPPPGQAP
jgi:protein-disulfide isomerase